jgi:hypothetical protein
MFSLATYITHKIEQMLWIRYWHHFGLDPRRNPHMDKKYTAHDSDYEKRLHYQNLASKTHLLEFWKQMNHIEKRKILGVISNIVKEVIKEDQECFSYPQVIPLILLFPTLSLSLIHTHSLILTPTKRTIFFHY